MAFTTEVSLRYGLDLASDMGWIGLVRIGSIVFGRNYLHGWFSIHPALPARENCEARAFGEVRLTSSDPAQQPHDHWSEPVSAGGAKSVQQTLSLGMRGLYICNILLDTLKS